jgi:hypothetical protein
MAPRARLIKETDYETRFRCAGGIGILREEVWIDGKGDVARYNLAFLLPHRFGDDDGRVLGYDNAHGFHERHLRGQAGPFQFESYTATARRFFREVQEMRREYEDESVSGRA